MADAVASPGVGLAAAHGRSSVRPTAAPPRAVRPRAGDGFSAARCLRGSPVAAPWCLTTWVRHLHIFRGGGCGRSGRRRVTGWQWGSCGRSRGPGPRSATRRGRVACGPGPGRRIGPVAPGVPEETFSGMHVRPGPARAGRRRGMYRHAASGWAGPATDALTPAPPVNTPRHTRRPPATGTHHAPSGWAAPATDALTRTEPVGGPPPVRGAGPRRTGCAAGGSPTRPPPLPWPGRRARRTAGSPAVRAEARPRSGR